jgi:hypothetical protein
MAAFAMERTMMTRHPGWRATAMAICVAAGLAAGVSAAGRGPVPAFPLTLVDGTPTTSIDEIGNGVRLIVYLSPGSAASDQLARLLKQWDSPALRARTLVVLGRDMGNAREWIRAAGDDLQPLRFAVDVGGEGFRALKLTGAPHLVGVEDAQVAWVVSGVLKTPGTLESVVKTWVGKP